MSDEPENDTQCELAAWEMLRDCRKHLSDVTKQRDKLAEALRNLKAEYDDRKNQFGDSPLWAKHEDVEVIEECHAMVAAAKGGGK